MNRDEKRTRPSALPPAIVDLTTRRAIFPREPNGGAWISANDAGVCIALINWYRIDRDLTKTFLSRGQIVEALAGKSSVAEIRAALAELPLRRLRPFRLIAIVPSEKTLTEWRWNLERLLVRKHTWRRRHWFSSGFDERKAEFERGRTCDLAQKQKSAGSLGWLRRLHRSHSPRRGPFSICMHRPDAATVSYTEVEVTNRHATMRYISGTSCSRASVMTEAIPLALGL